MKKSITLLTLLGIAIALSAIAPAQQKKIYPDRWVYSGANIPTDKDADALIDLIRTAAAHGFNGIVLSGVDRISTFTPEELARLTKVKEAADANHIEIIPSGFNTGYGGAILMHDKNLAEGLLVEDALFVAKDGSAQFVADSPAKLVNGDFEEYQGNPSSPTLMIPRSIRPVTTVPRPEIENTSSTGIRKGWSFGRSGWGM